MVVVLVQILAVVLTLATLGGLSVVLEHAVRSQWGVLALIVYAAWQLVLALVLLSRLAPQQREQAEQGGAGRRQKAKAQTAVEV